MSTSQADLAVIIPAAGTSSRFAPGHNKLLAQLCGLPVITWSVRAFLARDEVGSIIIPTQYSELIRRAMHPLDRRIEFCPGGKTRAHSVRNGLEKVPDDIEWVAVHDAARPLVSSELIDRTFEAACEHGAAVPAMPVNLTIKQASGPLPARVQRTLDRSMLWSMQTPQIMRRGALVRAFAECPLPLESITDDAQLLELIGLPVFLIPGDEDNLKITTELDLRLAELIAGHSMPE